MGDHTLVIIMYSYSRGHIFQHVRGQRSSQGSVKGLDPLEMTLYTEEVRRFIQLHPRRLACNSVKFK